MINKVVAELYTNQFGRTYRIQVEPTTLVGLDVFKVEISFNESNQQVGWIDMGWLGDRYVNKGSAIEDALNVIADVEEERTKERYVRSLQKDASLDLSDIKVIPEAIRSEFV